MSQLSLSNANNAHFSLSLLLSDLILLFSFLLSHPLYLMYLLFFSPYLLKLLSFLSPLFITTFLLLLAFLTLSPTLLSFPESSDSKLGSLLHKCGSLLDKLRPVVDPQSEDCQCFEELEAYKIVFEAATFEVRDEEELESEEKHILTENVAEENKVGELVEFGNATEKVKEKQVKAVGTEFEKVNGEGEGEGLTKGGSEEIPPKSTTENGGDCTSKEFGPVIEDDHCNKKVMELSPNLGSFGSMRKEKEWRRTLACKLFEERHNAEGGEGMDLLWETYETDSCKVKAKNDRKKSKKGEVEEEEDDDEDEDEEGIDRQLCCLQALKFSAGKMNLGMGRPNLVKISKALKGIGWLHHVSKLGRKGHR